MTEHKFKVGDRVRIVNKKKNALGSIGVSFGKEHDYRIPSSFNGVEAIVSFPNNNGYRLDNENGSYVTSCDDSELELIPQGKPYHLNGKTYYAFPEGKTIKELGIDTSRKFICLEDDSNVIRPGEILKISDSLNGNAKAPMFKTSEGMEHPLRLKEVAYYDEEEVKEEREPRVSAIWGGFCEKVEPLQIRANQLLTPTGKTLMQSCTESIVKFAKNLGLTEDQKALRQAGLQVEGDVWTNSAQQIIEDKEAISLGYKNSADLAEAMGYGDDLQLSAIELQGLFKKYYTDLVAIAKKFNKKDDKK